MTGGPVLSLKAVAKLYGSKLVFKGVSLELEPGQVLLVAGANGAGKSTLLKIVAGLIRPTSGEVRVGVDRSRVAYLGHATFVYPGLTAARNLAFWAGMWGGEAGGERVMEALARVGLDRVAHERAAIFSRGMLQRLNLARVYLLTPALILMDEPATGLDATSQAALRAEIGAARERGASVVFVSHDVRRDVESSDLALFLDSKRMGYLGPAPELPSRLRSSGLAC